MASQLKKDERPQFCSDADALRLVTHGAFSWNELASDSDRVVHRTRCIDHGAEHDVIVQPS
jgi:hypothetical protein